MTQAANPLVRRYLDELAAALGRTPLPLAEQAAIVGEIESHVAEAIVSGVPLADVLERLGGAEELARAYGVESFLNPRPERTATRFGRSLAHTLRLATRSAAVVTVGLLALCGAVLLAVGGLGAIASLVAPLLPLDPNLRAGLPQLVLFGLSFLVAALGVGLLRLVSWNLGLLRGPSTKEVVR